MKICSTQRQSAKSKVTLFLLPILVALLCGVAGPSVRAQSGSGIGEDTGTVYAPPPVRLWNWPDTAFLIGAYAGGVRDTSDRAAAIWPFLDAMGISTLVTDYWWVPGNSADSVTALRRHDTLAWSADPNFLHRLVYGQGLFSSQMGLAREVVFYPFDSVQSPYYPFRFSSTLDAVPGVYRLNLEEKDPVYQRPVQERVYDSASATPGAVIAEHIAFNDAREDERRTYRWPSQTSTADSVQNVLRWISEDLERDSDGNLASGDLDSLYFLVVSGHIFDQGTSSLTDSLLRIDVIYEVPQGMRYYSSSWTLTTAAADTGIVMRTFYITKSNLFPSGSPPYTWDAYRHIVLPLNLRSREGGIPGPGTTLNHANFARRFDIRVSWLGGERVALRSVALRDVRGQLALGNDSAAIAWRGERTGLMRRVLYGTTDYNVPEDSLRRAYFALYGGEEPFPTEYGGQQALINMVRDTFNVARPGGSGERDSVQIFDAQSGLGDFFHYHRLTSPPVVTRETYLHSLPVTDSADSASITKWYGLRYEELPGIAEENGGRFHLDEIDIWDSSSIEEYEKHLQRIMVGQYRPSREGLADQNVRDWLIGWGALAVLGPAARVSRATGRRLVQLPSINANLDFRIYNDGGTWKLDSVAGHFPTEAELRAMVNIGIAYGSKGVMYWTLGSYNNFLNHRYQNGPDTVWGSSSPAGGGPSGGGFGPVGCTWQGTFTHDTVTDVTDFPFHSAFSTAPSIPRVIVPDFYVGFGARTRAMKRMNERLAELASVLTGLTWRESYSIHYTVPWPRTGEMLDFGSRPVDSGEIITQVTARSPITGVVDSVWATYVELGLFDKKTDSTGGKYDPLRDRHFAYVVNRRTFQRPDWIDPSSVRGMRMDSLAESRIVTLRFNLPHPDSTQYPFIRVREVAPLADSIPLLGVRHVLDTVICGVDSTASIILPPGSGTLLEISFPPPDTLIVAGDLRWPGQRKFIHDGRRYHAFYHKSRSLPGGGTDNVVAWRWSYPVSDTTGAVLWAPTAEVIISDSLLPGDAPRTDNRFPGFTLRRVADSTWITAVWTCHPNASGHNGEREVVARNLKVVDIIQPYPYQEIVGYNTSAIYHVDYHKGTAAEVWGTPVISFTHGGGVIAWSDSAIGIVGRLFPLDLSSWIWPFPIPVLSARDSVSWPETQTYGFAGRYPTLPPWTPVARADSTVGISWRQPAPAVDDILYQRLKHTPADALATLKPAALVLSPWLGKRWYPSIDIVQDTAGLDHNEGIVWEDDFNGFKTLQFQSLKTSASGVTSLWNRAAYIVRTDDSVTTWPYGELYPQTAVLGEHDTSLFGQGRVQFAVGYQRPTLGGTPDLWQALVDWGRPTFKASWPNRYSYEGRYPSVAANRDQLWGKEAILYQANGTGGSDSTLRTSRQFFAKFSRPVGYHAQGRSVLFRLDAATRTGMQVLLYDPWYADAQESRALALGARADSAADVDTPEEVADLFRTETFTASDSLTVGCTLYGRFFGDREAAGTDRLELILEVVDSVTGNVVGQIDSIALSPDADSLSLKPERTLDLLTGSYYLRLRFGANVPDVDTVPYDCRYPVTEVAGWVENAGSAKGVRRVAGDADAGAVRISAQPNPFRSETELRFSIPARSTVTITVYDGLGRRVESPVEDVLFEKGRYAVSFPAADLPPGLYIVELRAGSRRDVLKMTLVR